MSAGPHWNPTNQAHGQWGHGAYHLGDIGNIEVGPDGKGGITFRTDLWSIGGKPEKDIVGRAVVVHANPDDFVTQPTGNAGGRIGCGVVRRAD
jgi:Cu-Zn family superoxide dismutase